MNSEDGLRQIASDITHSMRDSHFGNYEIGGYFVRDDKVIKITDGQFMGTYGVSNFWYWRELLKDGSLSDETFNGYGSVCERLSKGDAVKRLNE